MDLCVDAGETLLANGAEIYRVQQTMEIIARSYGRAQLSCICTYQWAVRLDGGRRCGAERGGAQHAARGDEFGAAFRR